VALLQASIQDKLAELAAEQAGPAWSTILHRVEKLLKNVKSWDWTRQERELTALAEAASQRRNEEVVWAEIRRLLDQKARLATLEHRRLVYLQQTMTVEQALTLAQVLGGIVRRHVTDTKVLEAIRSEWNEVTTAEQASRPRRLE